jgi:hypothetical protein
MLARLQAFRAGLHGCCTRRADALVDLTDALLSAPGPVASLPRLSLEPAHRRGWAASTPRWPADGSTPSSSATCWSAAYHPPTRWCLPWT